MSIDLLHRGRSPERTQCSYINATIGRSVGLDFLLFCGYHVSMAGRPKKPENDARANVLRIRLTEAEREAIDDAAKTRGLETSTWARMELLALARKTQRTK